MPSKPRENVTRVQVRVPNYVLTPATERATREGRTLQEAVLDLLADYANVDAAHARTQVGRRDRQPLADWDDLTGVE